MTRNTSTPRAGVFLAVAIVVSCVFLGPTSVQGAEAGRAWRPRAIELDERVLEIVDSIDASRMEQSVAALAAFGNRNTFATPEAEDKGIGGARRWILARFREISEANGGRLQVSEDPFKTSLPKDVAERLELADVDAANIVAILPGGDPVSRERLIVVGAHYDSRNEERYDVAQPAPGANDNAAGVAAVLELARVLSPHGFSATLVFVAFSAKEQGLWGSSHFARNARKDGLDIEAVLINDTIGNVLGGGGRVEGGRVRVFSPGPEDSRSRHLARYVKERGEAYVPSFGVELVQRADRINRSGDQQPFQEQGFAAVRLIEPAENFERQDSREDRPEFVHAAMLKRVTAVNAAALACLASGPPMPAGVVRNWEASHYDTRIAWSTEGGSALGSSGHKVLIRRTTSPVWQWEFPTEETDVEVTLRGISMDDHLIAVVAVDERGNESLPVSVR